MKELLNDNVSESIEIREEQQQKKEIKLIGQQRRVPGLTLWEYNEKTKELKEAKFQLLSVQIHSLSMSPTEINHVHKVVVNENCIYFQALNKKNALKKIA